MSAQTVTISSLGAKGDGVAHGADGPVFVPFALPGETVPHFKDRLYNYVVELHDSTARAYGMPTQEDFHRSVAIKAAAKKQAALEARQDETPGA